MIKFIKLNLIKILKGKKSYLVKIHFLKINVEIWLK